MANWIFDARYGRNPYPGRPKDDDQSDVANWRHQGRATTVTVARANNYSVDITNTDWTITADANGGVGHQADPASANLIGHFIRLIVPATPSNRVRKITAVTDLGGGTTRYTWATGTDNTANTKLGIGDVAGTITAIYIGGALLDLAMTWSTADNGTPAITDEVSCAWFFNVANNNLATWILPKVTGYPWAYLKSTNTIFWQFSGQIGRKQRLSLDLPSNASILTGTFGDVMSDCIIENCQYFYLSFGSPGTFENILVKNGNIYAWSGGPFRGIARNCIALRQTAQSYIGNNTDTIFANNMIRRSGPGSTALLNVQAANNTCLSQLQSNIFETTSETDSIIQFSNKTYTASQLKQEPSNQLATDSQFGAVCFRRNEAYVPSDPRSISNNINLSTGANRPDSVYLGYAYLGSPVAHIGFERAAYSLPIASDGFTNVDPDYVCLVEKVLEQSPGELAVVTDTATGRLVIQGTPPWTINWPAQTGRGAGPDFTGTGPDGETVNQKKLANGNYYQVVTNAFDVKRLIAMTTFRNGNDGTNDTLETIDSQDTENPVESSLLVEAVEADGTTYKTNGGLAGFEHVPYNDPNAVDMTGVKYIRYQIKAVVTTPRLA